jgi:hypothetical protein
MGTKISNSRVRFRTSTCSGWSAPPSREMTRSLSQCLPGVAPPPRTSKNEK